MPEARLVVVGCRPPVDEPGVEIVGPLRRSDPTEHDRLLELYATSTCFALCSRFDAFPNVVLEAGFYGLPVVATPDGSRPEAVLDGQTGILATDRSPEAVAAALLTVLTDARRAEAMSIRAHEHVRHRYTWPVVAGRLLAEMGLG